MPDFNPEKKEDQAEQPLRGWQIGQYRLLGKSMQIEFALALLDLETVRCPDNKISNKLSTIRDNGINVVADFFALMQKIVGEALSELEQRGNKALAEQLNSLKTNLKTQIMLLNVLPVKIAQRELRPVPAYNNHALSDDKTLIEQVEERSLALRKFFYEFASIGVLSNNELLPLGLTTIRKEGLKALAETLEESRAIFGLYSDTLQANEFKLHAYRFDQFSKLFEKLSQSAWAVYFGSDLSNLRVKTHGDWSKFCNDLKEHGIGNDQQEMADYYIEARQRLLSARSASPSTKLEALSNMAAVRESQYLNKQSRSPLNNEGVPQIKIQPIDGDDPPLIYLREALNYRLKMFEAVTDTEALKDFVTNMRYFSPKELFDSSAFQHREIIGSLFQAIGKTQNLLASNGPTQLESYHSWHLLRISHDLIGLIEEHGLRAIPDGPISDMVGAEILSAKERQLGLMITHIPTIDQRHSGKLTKDRYSFNASALLQIEAYASDIERSFAGDRISKERIGDFLEPTIEYRKQLSRACSNYSPFNQPVADWLKVQDRNYVFKRWR